MLVYSGCSKQWVFWAEMMNDLVFPFLLFQNVCLLQFLKEEREAGKERPEAGLERWLGSYEHWLLFR